MSTKQETVDAQQQGTVTADDAQSTGSILSGVFWMVLLSALLFWLPALGQLIAGYVGGKKAGGVFAALIAGILPAVIIGGGILAVSASMSLPVVGAILGGAASVIVLAYSVTLLIGALIGGALA